jgi:hypothetical protein
MFTGKDYSHSAQNGRTPADCAKQSLLSIPQSWGAEEDQNLLDAVLRYGENNWTLGEDR